MMESTRRVFLLALFVCVCLAATENIKRGTRNSKVGGDWSSGSASEDQVNHFFSNSSHTNNWAVLVTILMQRT